jgi:hypothetical protein
MSDYMEIEPPSAPEGENTLLISNLPGNYDFEIAPFFSRFGEIDFILKRPKTT